MARLARPRLYSGPTFETIEIGRGTLWIFRGRRLPKKRRWLDGVAVLRLGGTRGQARSTLRCCTTLTGAARKNWRRRLQTAQTPARPARCRTICT